MPLRFRSIIIIVGFVVLCNNTVNQAVDRSYESDRNEYSVNSDCEIGSSAVGQICVVDEECSKPSSKKESSTDKDTDSQSSTMAGRELVHVEFEVFGKVQGVFFRKNTVEQAHKLKLKGWCMNTPTGTVRGAMEGEPERINEMKHWLANIGSRMSRIDKAEFRNEKAIPTYSFPSFSVRH